MFAHTDEVGRLVPIGVFLVVVLLEAPDMKRWCSIWTESGEPVFKLFCFFRF